MMKISLGHLRVLVREALVTQMPLASVQRPGIDLNHPEAERGDTAKKMRGTQRFFKQQKFVDDAIKLYRNLSTPIYVVPAWSGKQRNFGNRVELIDVGELSRFNVSPQRIQEIASNVANGACVFVPLASTLVRGGLPTPWMIVHSIFDNFADDNVSSLFTSTQLPAARKRIVKVLWKLEVPDGFTRFNKKNASDFPEFAKLLGGLTMASARNQDISDVNDLVAEILTQAVLTTKGFVYNPTGDELVDNVLQELHPLIAAVKPMFEDAIAGKVILISVFERG